MKFHAIIKVPTEMSQEKQNQLVSELTWTGETKAKTKIKDGVLGTDSIYLVQHFRAVSYGFFLALGYSERDYRAFTTDSWEE